MQALLPVCLLGLLLLLHPSDAGRQVATARQSAAVAPAEGVLTLARVEPPSRGPAADDVAAVAASPLFADVGAPGAPPLTVAQAAPPALGHADRLLRAVTEALPRLGGTAEASWGPTTAVGPVLAVRWEPGEPLTTPDAMRDAVVAAVETVVTTMDTTFPEGFRSDQGAPLAAVQVVLPEHDPVLVAVRTYRELAAGETTLAQLPGQWRLLRRAEAPERAVATPRLVPEGPSAGAPTRWPPQIARWYPQILHAATVYQLDPDLVAAIMQQESGGRPDAVGAWAWIPHMGRWERAIGMMQIMPNEAERRGVSIDEAWEPEVNILLGARVLRDKLNALPGDFWTRVQGYYGFGDALSDYWLDRVYAYWLAFREPPAAP